MKFSQFTKEDKLDHTRHVNSTIFQYNFTEMYGRYCNFSNFIIKQIPSLIDNCNKSSGFLFFLKKKKYITKIKCFNNIQNFSFVILVNQACSEPVF